MCRICSFYRDINSLISPAQCYFLGSPVMLGCFSNDMNNFILFSSKLGETIHKVTFSF
jgi:hypothetical protein